MTKVYTTDHIERRAEKVIKDTYKMAKDQRTKQYGWAAGISIPKFASDPTVPSALSGQIFIYFNTTSNLFRKYVNGAWSNAGI